MRSTLSYRDIEDLLAERGLDISYETVHRWVTEFGPLFMDETVRTIVGKRLALAGRRREGEGREGWHMLDKFKPSGCAAYFHHAGHS